MLRGAKEVAQYARRIVHTLSKPRNASKPGWKDNELGELEEKIKEEFGELMVEIARLRLALYGQNPKESVIQELRKRVAEEATDLGCVAMMITDIVGGLDDA